MDIVIIGTGNAATVIGRKFKAAGHKIVQVVGRNSGAASELAYALDTISTNYLSAINRNAEETEFNYKDFDRNDRFKKIVRTFLEGKNDERFASLDDGIKSLEIVVAAKHATKNNSLVKIADVRNNHAE